MIPVQLYRDMGASVDVAMHAAVETHGERRLRPPALFDLEANPYAAIDQFLRCADPYA
jgi:hypothetical protein